MSPAPRVTVLLPVRDGERHVEEAVRSALGQTHTNLEVVVVDDGSTDQTPAILGRLAAADARVRVIRQEPSGLTSALCHGLALADGEYVARLDADDVALVDRLSKQVAFLDIHPHVAAVGGACILVDDDGVRRGVTRFPTKPKAISRGLLHWNCLAHPAVTMRRRAVVGIGGYRLEAGEDWDLWLRLSERAELANLPDPVVLYRLHAGQLSLVAARGYTLNSLAAVAAARRRRAGRPDPLDGVRSATPELLRQLGIPDRRIENALARGYARSVVLLEVRGRTGEAGDLLRLAAAEPGLSEAMLLAHVEMARAKSDARARRPAAAARALLSSLRLRPGVAARGLLGWSLRLLGR